MKSLIISLVLCSSSVSLASVDRLSSRDIHLKVGAKPIGYELKIGQQQSDSEDIVFLPSLQSQLSVSASIEGLAGVSWGFKTPPTEEDRLKKGETEYQDWRLSFPFESFRLVTYWVQYKGFYIENSGDVDTSWSGDSPYVQDPKLYSQATGIHFTWIHDPKSFSLVAPLDQTDRQTDSGGSWLYGVSARESFIRSDSAIIPAAVQSKYGEDASFSSSRFRSLILHGGYGYTYVPGQNWYLTGSLQLGVGPQEMTIQGDGFREKKFQTANLVEVILSAGYNGPDFFSGLKAEANETQNKTRSLKLSNNLYELELFIGTHL